MTMKLVSQSEPATATFEDFWLNYPKRVGKAKAKYLWDKIVGDGLSTKTLERDSGTFIPLELRATPEELVEAAKVYRKSQYEPGQFKLRDGGKYVCHPATWLNQGRWMDGD